VQLNKSRIDRIALVVMALAFYLFATSTSARAQVVSGDMLKQIWVTNNVISGVYYSRANFNYFQESNIVRYIHRQIYNPEMYRRAAYGWGRQSAYMPHSFSLMYNTPEYPDIKFLSKYNSIDTLKGYLYLMSFGNTMSTYTDDFVLKKRPVHQVIQSAVFSSPEFVDYLWKDIPDVSQVGKRKLRRKAVDRSISTLLRDTFNTKPSLERIIIRSSPWKFKGTENIQLSQGYLENWAKGGESSINLSSDLRFNANFTRGKHSWENYIVHKIGVLSSQDERGRVNDDLIEINTKYGLKSSEKWYYSFVYNFKTQFFYGYASSDKDHLTPISGFFAPAYMSFSLGMDYKPSNKFTLLLSPFTSRLTIVSDTDKFDETRYGIMEGENVKSLHGISVVNNFSYKLTKEIGLTSKLDLFHEYLNSDNERQVQIDWEIIIDMHINQLLSTRLLGNLRYFTNESDKVQIKEHFNIAFKYHF